MVEHRFMPGEIELSLAAHVESVVAAMPEHIAIVDGMRSLTYAELNQLANRLAHQILARRGPGSEPVAFCLKHGLSEVVAMLAIVKAGKYYLPLDENQPVAALREMLVHANAALLIGIDASDTRTTDLAAGQCDVVYFDQATAAGAEENPGIVIDPDALACLYYTSGSTGQPKGVMHTQRTVLHTMALIGKEWSIRPDERILYAAPCGFIAALYHVFGGICNGATVAPFDLAREGFSRLRAWLQQQRITIYTTVPTLFRNLAATMSGPEDLPDIRVILLGGEPFFLTDVELFRARFPKECRVHVIYGGTESLYVSQLVIRHTGEVAGPIVPIGYAVGDKEVLLRDEQGGISAAAGAGEFVVRSRYMMVGYLDRPDLTEHVLVPDPKDGQKQLYLTGDYGLRGEDGLLVYLGRKDSTVKIRGQRVELGAVEQMVRRCAGVKDAAVEARPDVTGNMYLVAYVVLHDVETTSSSLRTQLRLQLPSFMVPSQFMILESMPMTSSGKADRRNLPDPALGRGDLPQPYLAARDEVEAMVLEAVEEVLARRPIGVLDDFRDLGLDSVNLFRLWLRMEAGFNQELPLGTLPEPPTVENIAVLVRQTLLSGPDMQQAAKVSAVGK